MRTYDRVFGSLNTQTPYGHSAINRENLKTLAAAKAEIERELGLILKPTK